MIKFKEYYQNVINEDAFDIILDKVEKLNDQQKPVFILIRDAFEKEYKTKLLDALPFTTTKNKNILKLRRIYDFNFLDRIKDKQFSYEKGKKSYKIFYNNELIFTMQEGEGSRNKKAGGGKAGKDFEDQLAFDLNNFFNKEVKLLHPTVAKEVMDILSKDYDIDIEAEDFEAIVEGGKNQKRPLSFDGNNWTFGGIQNIGKIVTDVTVNQGGKSAFLSLKYSSQYYIINSSIRSVLFEKDVNKNIPIRNEAIKNFGFNPQKFLTAYGVVSDDDTQLSDSQIKANWEQLLKEIIGFGYIYIVSGGKHDVVSNKKTQKDLNDIKVENILEVLYAGKRKYSKITLGVKIGNKKLKLDCQFRGTTATDVLPYYLRVLVT